MCGICGNAGFIDEPLLARMVGRIAHRGPDDHGMYVSSTAEVGLGNCRLSIIDLSPAGHMPMSNEDGTVWITHNGEIYNFEALRSELQVLGHRFRSRSDTEVLIHGYEEWGTDLLSRLNGMFAFAVLDLRDGARPETARLVLARDRFGIKPLYYAEARGGLLFASEIKAILLEKSVRRDINLSTFDQSLTFLWSTGAESIFESVLRLPPAHYMVWQNGKQELHRYWDLRFDVNYSRDECATVDELRGVIRRSVQRHMISDVPVGIFLSGGIDSSTVLAFASEHNAGMKAYTIAYRAEDALLEQGAGEDAKFSRLIASHFCADYREILVDPNVVDLLPKVVWHLDEPVADPAAISTYLICEAARPELKVLLSGQGADEIFGGYRVYVSDYLAQRVARLPAVLRGAPAKGALRILRAATRLPLLHPGLILAAHRYLERLLYGAELPREERFIFSRTVFRRPDLLSVVSPEIRNEIQHRDPRRQLFEYFAAVPDDDFVNRMLYVDTNSFLVDLNLAYCDKLSAAASVETRVPFLDAELVDLLRCVPPAWKLHGAETKHLLRKAVRNILPAGVLRRRKSGFGAPIRKWLRYDLKEMVGDMLLGDAARGSAYFDAAAVQRLLEEDRRGVRDNSYQIWALLTFEVWRRTFIGEIAAQLNPVDFRPAMPRAENSGATLQVSAEAR